MSSWRSKLVAAVAAASLLAVGSAAASADAAAARPASPTSGCVGMDGAPVSGGGPSRATVVVDTGTGPVWSACISFAGSITGIDALERAAATITDLDPVYDQYVGLGRAVCRLRTVGSDPPDCLGKTAQYWSFSVNGRVASVGAGAVTVRDGDVHGWAYGTGGTPRSATMGSRATSAPPPTTTTVARPSPTTPRPTPTVPSSGPTPSSPQAPAAPSSGPGEADDGPGPAGSAPGASSDTTTTVAGEQEVGQSPATEDEPRSQQSESDSADDRELAAAPSAGSEGSTGGGGGPSGVGSLVGFGAALAAVGIAGMLVRRRRATAVV